MPWPPTTQDRTESKTGFQQGSTVTRKSSWSRYPSPKHGNMCRRFSATPTFTGSHTVRSEAAIHSSPLLCKLFVNRARILFSTAPRRVEWHDLSTFVTLIFHH